MKNNCVLVNCFTNDNKYGDVFSRIDNTITNSCTKFICASTVSVGDRCFDNYFAAIGIILGNSEVTISCAGDAGTQRDPKDPLANLLKDKYGVPFFDDEKGKLSPKLIDINNAIKERESGGHNEFILTKYSIKGFFLSGEPVGKKSAESTIKSAVPQEPGVDEEINPSSIFYLQTKKYNLRYYRLKNGKFTLLKFDHKKEDFEELFRVPRWWFYAKEKVVIFLVSLLKFYR